MSGHLLQTTNPEAAAEEHEVPEVGAPVIFHARPGQGRGGQHQFGATVLSANAKNGTCSLWVLYGPEDYREHIAVRMKTDQEPYNSWTYVDDSFDEMFELIAQQQTMINTQTVAIEGLKAALFGPFNPPVDKDGKPKSIVEFLAEFEQRVFAAEAKKK